MGRSRPALSRHAWRAPPNTGEDASDDERRRGPGSRPDVQRRAGAAKGEDEEGEEGGWKQGGGAAG